jgi:hypothetical protein
MVATEKNGTSIYKMQPVVLRGSCSRAITSFCGLVSGYDSVHIRANIPRLEEAIKYGHSAGDW